MRLLTLGGTWFLGRAIATHAGSWSPGDRTDNVSVFHRRYSPADDELGELGVTSIYGDRTDPVDVAALARQGPWDAVIDTSGGTPAVVLAGARALAPVAGHYVYVSTVNVYTGWPNDPLTERSPTYPAAATDEVDADSAGIGPAEQYGRAKAGCEQAVLECFGPERTTLLRPAVILGPGEYVGRLIWWLRRAEQGGTILAPGDPERTIQPVDVRDVAEFAVRCARQRRAGTFNVAAPRRATMEDLIGYCQQATGVDSRLVWVPDDFLRQHGVAEWTELPLWRTNPGTWAVDARRAIAAGLNCRPLDETVADTWSWLWHGGQPVHSPRAAEHGIHPRKEAEIIAEWTRRLAL